MENQENINYHKIEFEKNVRINDLNSFTAKLERAIQKYLEFSIYKIVVLLYNIGNFDMGLYIIFLGKENAAFLIDLSKNKKGSW